MSRNKMPAPPSANLEAGEHEKEPVIDLDGQPELDAASEEMPQPAPPAPKPVSKRMIKVRALRAGFIHNERKVEGDKFEVTEKELGSWMECMDPLEQKRHSERITAKRKAVNARGVRDHEREIERAE